ncbi:MAG: hypothetical protein R6W97_01610 [Thiobacillus sp.]
MPLVFLELGTLVGGNGILQRQRMQAQLVSETRDGVTVGRGQLDPDETIRLADMAADFVKRDGLGTRVPEQQVVDDGPRRQEKVRL